jgi:hypothetical protein
MIARTPRLNRGRPVVKKPLQVLFSSRRLHSSTRPFFQSEMDGSETRLASRSSAWISAHCSSVKSTGRAATNFVRLLRPDVLGFRLAPVMTASRSNGAIGGRHCNHARRPSTCTDLLHAIIAMVNGRCSAASPIRKKVACGRPR